MRCGRASSRLMLRCLGVLVALVPVLAPRAQAADRFVYTRHRELHAVDAKGGGLLGRFRR